MSETAAQLKNELGVIRGTALWKRYDREIETAIEWYSRELRSNPKIGQAITYGVMWQEQLSRLVKIQNMLDTIVATATKAVEDSGQPS